MAHAAETKRVGGKERDLVDTLAVHDLEPRLRGGGQLQKILTAGGSDEAVPFRRRQPGDLVADEPDQWMGSKRLGD